MSCTTAAGGDDTIWAYIDNNIKGLIDIDEATTSKKKIEFVFSSEHLTEIMRNHDPTSLLDALQRLSAQELSVELNAENEIVDVARVTHVPDVHARFREHVELMSLGTEHVELFQQFMAFNWGANNRETLLSGISALPGSIAGLVGDQQLLRRAADVADALGEQVGQMGDASAERFRKALGLDPRVISNYEAADAIDRIWDQMKGKLPGATKEVVFGRAPPDGRSHWPRYLAVLTCYGMLNTLGYRSDEQRARISGTRRAMSDGVHLANSSFCHVLLTGDKRFAAKARAVFKYHDVSTLVCEVQRKRS